MKMTGFQELNYNELYQVEAGHPAWTVFKWTDGICVVVTGKGIVGHAVDLVKWAGKNGATVKYAETRAGIGPVHPKPLVKTTL